MEVPMKVLAKVIWRILIFLIVFLLSIPCYAQDPFKEKVGSFGFIDWGHPRVIATGTGAPPQKYYGKPQARPMAMRAAVVDARRNLLEVIKGVHIDSVTTVKNKMYRDDTVITRVTGVVKTSSVDDIQYLSDGTVQATVSMPLTGELSEILLTSATPSTGRKRIATTPYPGDENLRQLEKRLADQENRLNHLLARLENMADRLAALEKSGAKGSQVALAAKTKSEVPFSGLVIDARQIGFRPSLKPEIFSQNQRLYPGDYVDLKIAVRQGYVRYARKLTRAQQLTRAGSLPFTIKAKGTYQGSRSLEIKAADFETLKRIIEIPNNFMQNCNLVIVF